MNLLLRNNVTISSSQSTLGPSDLSHSLENMALVLSTKNSFQKRQVEKMTWRTQKTREGKRGC